MRKQVRIGYDKKNDEFQVRYSCDGGKTWEMSLGCKCQLSKHDVEGNEPEFIHISLIEELKNFIAAGYTVVY